MTHEELQGYYERLDVLNNNINNRHIRIEKNSKLVADLRVTLASSKPIINTPEFIQRDMMLYQVQHEIGKYQDYTFKEATITVLPTNTNNYHTDLPHPNDQERADYLKRRLDTDGNDMSNGRYIPYLTIINPVTRTDITIFIDKKHGDMFCVSGLNFLLKANLELNTDLPILTKGYRIGGKYTGSLLTPTEQLTPSATVTVEDIPDIGNKFEYSNLLNQDSDVLAFGIVFTKELPSNSSSANFPTVYDFLEGPTGVKNVQLARQDSYPCIYVKLGKLSKFLKPNLLPEQKKVFNWVIYNSHITRMSLRYNSETSNENTMLGVILNLY